MAAATELLNQDPSNPQADIPEHAIVGDDPVRAQLEDQVPVAGLQVKPMPGETQLVPKKADEAGKKNIGNVVLRQPDIKKLRRNGARPWWGIKKEQSCSSCGSGENRMGMSLRAVDCSHCGGHGPTSQSRQ